MRLLASLSIAAALFATAAHAQFMMGPSNPGCPLSGCTYTGPVSSGAGTAVGLGTTGWAFLPNGGGYIIGAAPMGAGLTLGRSDAAGAAGNIIGQFSMRAANGSSAAMNWSYDRTVQTGVTSGSETAERQFWLKNGGSAATLVDYMTLDPSVLTLLQGGVLVSTGGTAPVISSCGTGPTDTRGTNMAGRIKVGTSPSTTCTLSFATSPAYSNTPTCGAWRENGVAVSFLPSTSGISMTSSAAFVAGEFIAYTCVGN